MKLLEQIISRMSVDERVGFRDSLKSVKHQKHLITLFDKLCADRDWNKNEISKLIYGSANLGSYHSLRKRLMRRVNDYIAYLRFETDKTDGGSVLSLLYSAQFLLERDCPTEANQFLVKAEKTAIQNDQYDALNMIYGFQLLHHVTLKINLENLITKLQNNLTALTQTNKLDIAFAEIQEAHDQMKISGKNLAAETVLKRIFADKELMNLAKTNVGFMFRIVTLCRKVITSAKDYHMFEPYVIGVYNYLKSRNAFQGNHAKTEIHFIYMIVHALYRTLKFDETRIWLKIFYDLFPQNRVTSHPLYPKYISTVSALEAYTGKAPLAIDILNETLNNSSSRLPVKEKLNMQLNLAVYYFSIANYKEANKSIGKIQHSNTWLDNLMGKEWRFKRDTIEVIIFSEKGESELAQSRLALMKKNYADFLNNMNYIFASMFLNFIGKIIENSAVATSKEFAAQIKEAADKGWPGERNDIQAITFFCWIKCKMEKRDYYSVLVEWTESARIVVE